MIREWMLWLQDALGHEMRMDARDMQRAELRMLPTPGSLGFPCLFYISARDSCRPYG